MSARLLAFLFILFLLLAFRFWFYFSHQPAYRPGASLSILSRLSEEPDLASSRQRFAIYDQHGNRINITTSSRIVYHYGDRLRVAGILTQKYNRYYLSYPTIQILTLDHNYLSQIDVLIKSTSKNIFYSALPQTSSALLLGMIFGGRQGMPQDFLDQLRITGVIHVIAASGMNVTMVASVLLTLFSKILKRQLVLILTILCVFLYALLAGLEASIVRAAIMAVIALSAGLFGRQYFSSYALIVTAFIMLLLRPLDLFDIGFQLSFLSTWGIIALKPLLPFQKFFLADDITTTISAQVATLPVLLATFGQYGLLSILVNACVLWTVPFLMIFGVFGLLAGFIYLPLAKLVLWICWPLLIYFEQTVSFFSSYDLVLNTSNLTWQFIFGYYLILLSIILFFRKRTRIVSSSNAFSEISRQINSV